MNNHRALCFLLCEAANGYAAGHPLSGQDENPCLIENTLEYRAAHLGQIYAYVINVTGGENSQWNTEFPPAAAMIANRYAHAVRNGIMPEEDRDSYFQAANSLIAMLEANTAPGTFSEDFITAAPHEISVSEAYSTGFQDGFDWGTGFPRHQEEDMSVAVHLYANEAIGETLSNEISL